MALDTSLHAMEPVVVCSSATRSLRVGGELLGTSQLRGGGVFTSSADGHLSTRWKLELSSAANSDPTDVNRHPW